LASASKHSGKQNHRIGINPGPKNVTIGVISFDGTIQCGMVLNTQARKIKAW